MSTSNNKVSIGIDLGTTYSSIAYTGLNRERSFTPIANIATDKSGNQDRYFIPSSVCVCLEDDNLNWVFGKEAIQKADDCEDISHLYEGYKLLIGENFDTNVQSLGLPKSKPQVMLNDITPHFVAQKLIEHLRTLAYNTYEGALNGLVVQSISVTVPALWPEIKKKCVEELVQAAGFQGVKVRTIEEPIAALYYQIHAPTAGYLITGSEKYVLVIDYGGGTCDVAVVKIFNDAEGLMLQSKKIAEVIGRGSHNQGGVNIDNIIANHIRKQFLSTGTQISDVWLLHEAEKLKVEYSNQIRTAYGKNLDNTSILNYCLHLPQGQAISVTMTINDFLDLLKDELSRMEEPIKHALNSAQVDLKKIEHVFLAGGTSLLPLVLNKVKKFFNEASCHPEFTDWGPRHAIVYGAAFHAHYLDTGQGFGIGITLKDNIWMEGLVGSAFQIAKKNDPLPHEYKRSLIATNFIRERSIKIAFYKGDSHWVSRNEELVDNQNETKMYSLKRPVWLGTRLDLHVKIHESGLMDINLNRHNDPEDKIEIKSEVPTGSEIDQIAERAKYSIKRGE